MFKKKLLEKIEGLTEKECLTLLTQIYEDEFNYTRTSRTQAGCSRWSEYRYEYIQNKLKSDLDVDMTHAQISNARYG